MLLADVVVQARQVADNLGPTVVVGEVTEDRCFAGLAMPTQVRRVDAIA
jgi:hypothetical protein